ncbi:hypothetical protein NVT87_07920 [Acinetobacter radioresistens]|jgi:hypothetical protein|uniref:hypothetical protein n=1 Tax=Acinetobacter radioresistens TaxID=40216 RepID=UPI002004C846|nr:hypothetical protein [Acinetobacter radioresistens]MCK4086762.1 hypothetical protein [Acinetobacter radioresistens]MCK4106656.1 hypothetical protein [Acinetobacter radioresistens]MCX0330808.1 hypothetical protein [Acinetobacter radioresistens]
MLKKILATFIGVFLTLSSLIILYWRDVQYEPERQDFLAYFGLLPLAITCFLLSPWLIYRAYLAYQSKKKQAELAQQKAQEAPSTQVTQQIEWLKLNIYTAHVYSALGEDGAILEQLKEYTSPELDLKLQNSNGLPILSYRIEELDEKLGPEQDEDGLTTFSVRQQRIMALVEHQLEKNVEVLLQVAEHLKYSSLFYETQQIHDYRMHPAWIDPGAEYDPDEVAIPELKQVERLDRLNLHILLSEDLQRVWNETAHQNRLQEFFSNLGIIPQKIHLEYHFLGVETVVHDFLILLKQQQDQTQEISLIISADSEIDQEIIDERIWISDHYLPAEFSSSCCIASTKVNFEQLLPLKRLVLAINQNQVRHILKELNIDELPQYKNEEPFVVVLDDITQIKTLKRIEQYFEQSPIEPHHYLYCRASLGHTQNLEKIYGMMLGMLLPPEQVAVVFGQDIQAIIQDIPEEIGPREAITDS